MQEHYGTHDTEKNSGHRHQRVPRIQAVHAALVVVYCAFGGGAFVSKFGIHTASPLLFEFIREAAVAPILIGFGWLAGGRLLPDRRDAPQVIATSLCFAGSQASFFLGLKHADPTVGTTWQTSLPVFTTAIAVLVGAEDTCYRKGLGITLASGGAACMTFGDYMLSPSQVTSSPWGARLSGHILFFCQCVLTSLYIISSKRVVTKYGACIQTAWVFSIGTVLFLCLILGVRTGRILPGFLCEASSATVASGCQSLAFAIDKSMLWPLLYEVVCCSVVAWYLLSWAIQYARPSTVSTFTVVQPITSCVLSLAIIGVKGHTWAHENGISTPGIHNVVGVVLIMLGIYTIGNDDHNDGKDKVPFMLEGSSLRGQRDMHTEPA